MGIKIGRAAEDLSRDLIFLEGNSGMLQRVVRKIAQQLAKRLGTMERMAVHQPLDLNEPHFRVGYVTCHTHVTEGNKPVSHHATQQLTRK